MNVEQLLRVSTEISGNYQYSKLLNNIDLAIDYSDKLSKNPRDAEIQKKLIESKIAVEETVSFLEDRSWSLSTRIILDELGVDLFIPSVFRSRFQNCFIAEGYSPDSVFQDLSSLKDEITEFFNKMSRIRESLRGLGLEEVVLGPGEAELEYMIPRSFIDNKIHNFAYELKKFDQILHLVSVVATGSREEFDLLYLSTSEPRIFVRPSLKTTVLFMQLVSGVLVSIAAVAELYKSYDDLRGKGISEEGLSVVKNEIDSKMRMDIERIVTETMEERKEGMKDSEFNENFNRLIKSLEQLAPRLERGVSVDARVGVIEDSDKKNRESDDVNGSTVEFEVSEVRNISNKIRKIAPPSTPLLSIPEDNGSESGG